MTTASFNQKLKEYARLTASMGVNVKEGQYVLLRCAVEAVEFGRMVQEECFKLGAKDVIFVLEDQRAARIRLDYASLEQFENIPEWRAEQRNFYAREGCVCINIIAEDPEIFAGAPSDKMTANTLAADRAFKEFYDIMLSGGMRWTIVAYPCEAWAKKVFPELTAKKAI